MEGKMSSNKVLAAQPKSGTFSIENQSRVSNISDSIDQQSRMSKRNATDISQTTLKRQSVNDVRKRRTISNKN